MSILLNPKSFLNGLTGKLVIVNMQLANIEEYIDGALANHLEEVLIKCNNVPYIKGVEDE
ncbi:small nuclear ribonucleoprotein F-like [Hemiscyllium ocellatum]|uniref:small nuclear ribonucleoprotein F-like n=1 Tax=Hemiscyllium ocellatum TaxID=170820 RepID=UPI002966A915|nr:small nuclear ribonucleoprotein F-like [Hemiscyllium ocellatum]